jgi:hypothetical protein
MNWSGWAMASLSTLIGKANIPARNLGVDTC